MKITLLSDSVTPATRSTLVAESVQPTAIGETPTLPMTAECAVTGDTYPLSELTKVFDGRLVCTKELADHWAICSVTHEWYPREDLTLTFDGRLVCESELDANWSRCSVRGSWHPNDDMTTVHDGDVICSDERDDNWSRCEVNEEWYPNDDMCTVHDRNGDEIMVCDAVRDGGNYTQTEDGEWHHIRNVVEIHSVDGDDYYVTRDQYRDGEYFTCHNCGHIFHEDDMEIVNGQAYCTECAQDVDEDEDNHRSRGRTSSSDDTDQSELIRGYSNTSYPAPLGDDPRKYGIELEVEMTEGSWRKPAAKRVMDALSSEFVILKEDGSLNRGFEIVTAPASFDEHRKRWPAMLQSDEAKKGLVSWDAEKAGLHIHITRSELSQLQIGKMLVFTNASANKTFVDWVAGRGSGSYCTRVKKKLGDGHPNRLSGSRYEAINTTRSDTIEVRLFRGTINHDRVMSYLDFTDALVEFCAPTVSGLGSLESPNEFIAFVKQNRKRWEYLYKRLVADRYLPEPPKPKLPPSTPNSPKI